MGNILIGVATLIYFGMLVLIYSPHPNSGQYGVGLGWMLILGNFGFVLCLAIITGIISSKGGFSWIASDSELRFVLVLAGFIVIMVGNVLPLFSEGLRGLPPVVIQILNFTPAVLPLLLFLKLPLSSTCLKCAVFLLFVFLTQSCCPMSFHLLSL